MRKLIMMICLMLSVFTPAAQAQLKTTDNQNKTNMESNTIKLTERVGRHLLPHWRTILPHRY